MYGSAYIGVLLSPSLLVFAKNYVGKSLLHSIQPVVSRGKAQVESKKYASSRADDPP